MTLGVFLLTNAAIGIAMRLASPGLMTERVNWRRKDTKPFDRIFMRALIPLIMIQPVVAGMDAVRFGWWPISESWFWPGAAIFAAGGAIVAWSVAVNRHAETTVRIQTDRGHTVITTGPYRLVRHPMYVGIIVMYVGSPVLLGSGACIILSLLTCGLFIWRTYMEDGTLQRELPGYPEYASHTTYKLMPGIW